MVIIAAPPIFATAYPLITRPALSQPPGGSGFNHTTRALVHNRKHPSLLTRLTDHPMGIIPPSTISRNSVSTFESLGARILDSDYPTSHGAVPFDYLGNKPRGMAAMTLTDDHSADILEREIISGLKQSKYSRPGHPWNDTPRPS
jgi:hypothetical protein